MNTDTIKLLLVDLQLFAYSGYGNKKANPQDDDRNTYIDDRGVERYVGSNNRVGGNVNDNTGKYATKTVEAPKKSSKTTTAYTKDGKIYTFEGDNWVNYAKDNGITTGLSRAITYPSYVTANEANRFLNEQADRYGVKLNSPVGAYESAVSKEYAAKNNLIPDYSTPFASAAAGQTNTNYDLDALKRLDQAYLGAVGSANGINPGNSYYNNNGAINLKGYTPLGTYNDIGLNSNALNQIKEYQKLYEAARQIGDRAAMEAAHGAAESIRAQYGYSGGIDGSDYIGLGYNLNNNANTGGFNFNVSQPVYDYNSVVSSKPTWDGGSYDAQLEATLNQILNRDDFSYNIEDDPLFQQYKNQYLREGQRAMNDTLASAAAGAGGMNSYAISAANQAQNYYNAQLGDKIPELYQLAYEKWLDEIELKVRDLGLIQQMDDTQYSRFMDTLEDWRNDRDFGYSLFRDEVNDSKWQTEFDYNAGRDAVNDSRYENEWSYNTSLDSYENAYNQAMQFLAAGIMPSSELLAKAGISLSEAQAYINKVNGKSVSNGSGSGGSGSGGGGSTGSNGYTGSGYEPNNNAVNGDEYGRIPARVSEAELRSVVEKYPDRFEITEVYDDETGKTTYKYKYKG